MEVNTRPDVLRSMGGLYVDAIARTVDAAGADHVGSAPTIPASAGRRPCGMTTATVL